MESLLITGDFMELTNVTRNTLIHYDNLGILKPVMTNKRGDRFYHPFQAYTMSLIQNFQAAGMSLESIKKAFEESEKGSGVVDVYKNDREEIDAASKELHAQYRESVRAYRYIEKNAYMSEKFGRHVPGGEPRLTSVEVDGNTVITYFDRLCSMIEKSYYNQVSMHIKNMYGRLRDGTFPICTHFKKEDFMEGSDQAFAISSYTKYGHSDYAQGMISVDCVVLRRIGDAAELPKAMQTIREYMRDNSLVLIDDVLVVTSTFNVDGEGKRYADRLIVAPVVPGDGTQVVKFNSDSKERLSQYADNQADIDQLVTSGEFIKMCGITRNTLNFYEKHKLIKPAMVRDNGYKMYGVAQLFNLINIKGLKQAGFSIEEIKHQIKFKDGMFAIDAADYSTFVENQKKLIRSNINKYASKIQAMKNICRWLEKFARIEEQGKEDIYINKNWFYRAIPYEKDNKGSTVGVRHELVRTVKIAKENPDAIPYPIGAVLSPDLDPQKDASLIMVNPGRLRHGDRQMNGLFRVYSMRADGIDYRDKIKAFVDEINNEGKYRISGNILSIFYSIETRVTKNFNLDEMKLICAVIFPLVKR